MPACEKLHCGQMHEKKQTGAQIISVNECETLMSLVLMIFKMSSCAARKLCGR